MRFIYGLILAALLASYVGSPLRVSSVSAAPAAQVSCDSNVINCAPDTAVNVTGPQHVVNLTFREDLTPKQRLIGSDFIASGSTVTYNFSDTPNLFGTQGRRYANADEARAAAILLAQGEAAKAKVEDASRVIELISQGSPIQFAPVDERTITINGSNSAKTGENFIVNIVATDFVSVTVDYGDGSPRETVNNTHLGSVPTSGHTYSSIGTYTLTVYGNNGITKSHSVTVTNATNPAFTLTATPNPVPYGALVQVTFVSNVGGNYCLDWDLNDSNNSDQYCHNFAQDGGTFTVPHVFDVPAGGLREIGVRDSQLVLLRDLTLVLQAMPVSQVTFSNLVNPAMSQYGATVSFDVCASQANFDGTIDFADGQNSGRVLINNGSCLKLEHKWVNTSGIAKIFTVKATRFGETSAIATLNIEIASEMAPQQGTVTLVVVSNPALNEYGKPVSFKLCTQNAGFNGKVLFNDTHDTGVIGVGANQCYEFSHVFVNQTNASKTFTVLAIRTGETAASASVNVTVRQEMFNLYLGMIVKAFNVPTLQISTQAPANAQTDVTFTVNAGSARTMWVDFGNNLNSGQINATADGQSFTFTTRYRGDYQRGEQYPVQLSYLDQNGALVKLPPVMVTTNYTR